MSAASPSPDSSLAPWSERLLAANPGLARHPRAELLAAVAGAALEAVDPQTCVRRHVHLLRKPKGASVVVGEFVFDLADDPAQPGPAEHGRVWIFGAGKASERTAAALVERLGGAEAGRVAGGLVIAKHRDPELADAPERLRPVEVVLGDHPLPGPKSAAACARLRELARQVQPRDLVLCPISGGSSALLSDPVLPAEEWSAMVAHFLSRDVPIHPINWLRRRCDALKAGGLARLFAPAAVVSLIISDVIGDELALIGSGPTIYPDKREPELDTIRRDLGDALSEFLRDHPTTRAFLDDPPPLPEPPRDESGAAQQVHHVLLARNGDAREAACATARSHGLDAVVLLPALSGPAADEGRRLGQLLVDMPEDLPVRSPACIVTGGETTVNLELGASGAGGRNQELALAAAAPLATLRAGRDRPRERAVLLTLATDGEDGPTDAAGALVDPSTEARAQADGLDPEQALRAHDSHTLLARLEDTLRTGPTGTNVCDLALLFRFD
ncbi:probable hydroxypyruvate reductase; probable glycerate kinase [Plesiocystis pacifica SIR-1]|uniref:Probable hydroxypyruvate reductase probable glycerate kinase n=1 Tax=Plesiocystis pacifica SIR-1 TaxID=391625 RepID=A6GGC1_9BACT|nr:DUF4147 domain-containing protein [Plesiocystis pacifica]EDM75095.1 probable hydroxypyruvate reductase; probable glycerate kinase [Plesiocystis pacifica SIR-1]